MNPIAQALHHTEERIERACADAHRPRSGVALLAVSKTKPAADVRSAFEAGQRDFGENYVQEALAKIAELQDLRRSGESAVAIRWHLIGPLQSNKTRDVAAQFDWVHSVDRLRIAQRLSDQRPADLPPLQVCLQVNVSGEPSKSGVAPHELPGLAQAVSALPRLRLRGLMSIPEPAQGLQAQREPHRRLRELLQDLQRHGLPVDTLSMGMSDDLEAAVLEGSTMVRVGTAIFGARAPRTLDDAQEGQTPTDSSPPP